MTEKNHDFAWLETLSIRNNENSDFYLTNQITRKTHLDKSNFLIPAVRQLQELAISLNLTNSFVFEKNKNI